MCDCPENCPGKRKREYTKYSQYPCCAEQTSLGSNYPSPCNPFCNTRPILVLAGIAVFTLTMSTLMIAKTFYVK
jgi:hypothetical protein